MLTAVSDNWPAECEHIAKDDMVLRALVGSTVHGLERKGLVDRDGGPMPNTTARRGIGEPRVRAR